MNATTNEAKLTGVRSATEQATTTEGTRYAQNNLLSELPGAVFGLIRRVVDYADRSGRETSLCGDLAGDPEQVAALLDQGLRTFSVAPGALGPVKAAISRYSGPAA